MSTQQFKGKVEMLDDVSMKGHLTSEATKYQRLGRQRVETFEISLSGIDGSSVNFTSDDVLVNVGALDVASAGIGGTATHITIEKVVTKVTQIAGTTLAANLAVGTSASDAVNATVTNATEIAGAGATYSDPQGGDSSISEGDLDLQTAGVSVVRPNITVPVARNNLYVRTHTALSAALTQGASIIEITYSVY